MEERAIPKAPQPTPDPPVRGDLDDLIFQEDHWLASDR